MPTHDNPEEQRRRDLNRARVQRHRAAERARQRQQFDVVIAPAIQTIENEPFIPATDVNVGIRAEEDWGLPTASDELLEDNLDGDRRTEAALKDLQLEDDAQAAIHDSRSNSESRKVPSAPDYNSMIASFSRMNPFEREVLAIEAEHHNRTWQTFPILQTTWHGSERGRKERPAELP